MKKPELDRYIFNSDKGEKTELIHQKENIKIIHSGKKRESLSIVYDPIIFSDLVENIDGISFKDKIKYNAISSTFRNDELYYFNNELIGVRSIKYPSFIDEDGTTHECKPLITSGYEVVRDYDINVNKSDIVNNLIIKNKKLIDEIIKKNNMKYLNKLKFTLYSLTKNLYGMEIEFIYC